MKRIISLVAMLVALEVAGFTSSETISEIVRVTSTNQLSGARVSMNAMRSCDWKRLRDDRTNIVAVFSAAFTNVLARLPMTNSYETFRTELVVRRYILADADEMQTMYGPLLTPEAIRMLAREIKLLDRRLADSLPIDPSVETGWNGVESSQTAASRSDWLARYRRLHMFDIRFREQRAATILSAKGILRGWTQCLSSDEAQKVVDEFCRNAELSKEEALEFKR